MSMANPRFADLRGDVWSTVGCRYPTVPKALPAPHGMPVALLSVVISELRMLLVC